MASHEREGWVTVLPLNGTGQRGGHDAAACLLIDGRIAAFTLNRMARLATKPFLINAQRKHASEQETLA
jgi:hypothetical protein